MTASARNERPRIHQLDALRGLLALGVMVYHLVPGTPAAFGTWGVYAFFVLSGYALDHVYRGRLDLGRFAIARVARLAPLWIPVVLVSAAIGGIADPVRILLNVTGAFGFVHPGATSIATGGWSIGIEVVCYAAFPLLLRLSTRGLAVVTAAAIALRFAWVGGLMPADLVASWVPYTDIPSFLCFFAGGMLASRLELVRAEWTGWLARAASALGDASYGVYLLHPLVGLALGPAALVVTPPLAWAIRRGYEIPVGERIRLIGRRAGSADLERVELRRMVRGRHAAITKDRDSGVGRPPGLELDGRRAAERELRDAEARVAEA